MDFRKASEAAERWLHVVRGIAFFGEQRDVDRAYRLLLPAADRPGTFNLQDSYGKHAEALIGMRDKLRAISDGPITIGEAEPLTAGSGHEAAVKLAARAICYLAWPSLARPKAAGDEGEEQALIRPLLVRLVDPDCVEEITDPREQHALAAKLLAERWPTLAIPQQQQAELEEQIRCERAKLQYAVIWLQQKDVAEGLGLSSAYVGELVERGELRANGTTGKAKRIDLQSVLDFCRRKGTEFTFPGT